MRPTDNLAGGGAPPFPYVLAGDARHRGEAGSRRIRTRRSRIPRSTRPKRASRKRSPAHFHVAASAIVSLARRLPITVDTNFDPEKNPGKITYAVVDGLNAGPIKDRQITVPFFASWPSSGSATGTAGRLNANYQQITELMSRSNSTYEAADAARFAVRPPRLQLPRALHLRPCHGLESQRVGADLRQQRARPQRFPPGIRHQ